MMRKQIHYFNIVEIALALAIVGIGIAGIMSLFPVALNATRDSIGDNNAPDVAEQFVAYMQSMVQAEGATDLTLSTIISKLPTSNPETASPLHSWGPVGASKNVSQDGSYPGCYLIQQGSYNTSGDLAVVDFSAVVSVWKSPVMNFFLNGVAYGSSDATQAINQALAKYAVALNIEISWPAEKPYSSREKRRYYLEIFNLNATN